MFKLILIIILGYSLNAGGIVEMMYEKPTNYEMLYNGYKGRVASLKRQLAEDILKVAECDRKKAQGDKSYCWSPGITHYKNTIFEADLSMRVNYRRWKMRSAPSKECMLLTTYIPSSHPDYHKLRIFKEGRPKKAKECVFWAKQRTMANRRIR